MSRKKKLLYSAALLLALGCLADQIVNPGLPSGFSGVANQIQAPNGSAAVPSYSFSANTSSGIWDSSGFLVFSSGGVNSFEVGSTQTIALLPLVPNVDNATDLGVHAQGWRHITTGSSDTAGTATLSTGAATVNFGTAFTTSAPICTCTDTTAAAAVKCSATTSALTIAGTGSDVIAYHCIGK